ncbi:MAG: transglutaminase domain-containing protein [Chlorobi bacterium]|nr:transglutaminase domain-containing protein [Chlorobiota bacterium]
MRSKHRSILLAIITVATSYSALSQVAGERLPEERLLVRVLSTSHDFELDRRSLYYPFPFAPTDSIAAVYRERVARYSLRLDGLSELDAFRTALAWVGTRWIHHSDNTVPPSVTTLDLLERAQKGERFTCVEYARLLVDVLVSYGYPARIVGLSKPDIEIRPRGARHVAVEAWSTTHHKWVFLDPQWGVYPCLNGQWMSAYELIRAIAIGKLNEIELIATPEVCTFYRTGYDEYVEQYRSFLSTYTGYLDYPYVYNGKFTLMMYICDESLSPPLAFQGTPLSGLFYTRSWQKAYGSLDQTIATFTYTGAYTPRSGFTDPEYTLELATTMPWIRHYEVRFNGGPWTPIDGVHIRWRLRRGINTIEARVIGWNGLRSRHTFVKLFWGTPTELAAVNNTP